MRRGIAGCGLGLAVGATDTFTLGVARAWHIEWRGNFLWGQSLTVSPLTIVATTRPALTPTTWNPSRWVTTQDGNAIKVTTLGHMSGPKRTALMGIRTRDATSSCAATANVCVEYATTSGHEKSMQDARRGNVQEGIEYSEIGTVDVTFDEKTYHLGRPKFRQFKHFAAALEDQRQEVVSVIERINAEREEAEARYEGKEDSPEAKAELRRLQDALADLNKTPFYERTITILQDMFAQVGDPLPDDVDDWPAWLAADSSLPGKILNHWKTSPKASGEVPRN
jgi:hypothetical protein